MRFDVLLYDLTNQHLFRVGSARQWQAPFALAYEVLPGNTSDKTTLEDFLKKIEAHYGKAQRVWLMDRGIPTEASQRR